MLDIYNMQQEQNFCAFRNGETCHINKLESVKLSQILIIYVFGNEENIAITLSETLYWIGYY